MTNAYYNFTTPFVPGNKVRAGAENTQFSALQAAFDLLPASPTAPTHGTATLGVESGAGNAYVITMGNPRTSNTDGDEIVFKATHGNSAAATIKQDIAPAVAWARPDGSPLLSGDIVAGRFYAVRFNGTSGQFETSYPMIFTAAGALTYGVPSVLVGLSSSGGAATSVLRSDAGLALNQGIAPTWTGQHIFSGGNTVQITGTAASYIPMALFATGQAAGSRAFNFEFGAGGDLQINAADDAGATSSGGAAVSIARTGVNVTGLSFGNATSNPAYNFLGSGAINGVGSGLTALNATNITSGTLVDARLSVNVPLLDATSNTFSLSQNANTRISVINTNVGAAASASLFLGNDASPTEGRLIQQSQAMAGSFTNAPAGALVLGTAGGFALSLGTAQTERIRIAGDGSVINFKATAVQVNGNDVTSATNLTSGTLLDARLSANVPLLNATANNFSSNGVAAVLRNTNTNAGATAQAFIGVGNNVGNDRIYMGVTGSAFIGPFITGGPSGESTFVTSITALPLSLGTSNTERVRIDGAGASINLKATAIQGNGIDMTPSTSNFTGTFTGFSSANTGTVNYTKIGNLVCLRMPGIDATSNATTFTMTGLPAAIQPASGAGGVTQGQDAGVLRLVAWSISGGTITFSAVSSTGVVSSVGFTASGTKGLAGASNSIVYMTN